MEQVRSFNQNTAGKTPNMCLANVTAGYGIPNKYASAWQAWQHTQQHTDRNVPQGVDVPLYYSYTATIDGSTQNYGHINVRLANGTVWSDGNIYENIDAYLANHTPEYVGWGESVNDVTVIKGGITMTPDALNELAQAAWNKDTSDGEVKDLIKNYTGKSPEQTILAVLNSDSNKALRTKAAWYDNLQAALNSAYTTIDELQKQTSGDTSKKLSQLQSDIKSALDKSQS